MMRLDLETTNEIMSRAPTELIERKKSRPLLLCLSHLRWNFVWQRPQHLLTRAARHYDVIFFEEPIWKPVERPDLELVRANGVTVAVPILPESMREKDAIDAQRMLLNRVLAGRSEPALLWYYTPMAIPFSRHIDADTIVYDNMDELSAFRGASAEMLANEDELFGRADLVFTGGVSLFEAKRHRHSRVYAFPSSIDAGHFAVARARDVQEPADQACIQGPKLGFFGVIDERLDLVLLADIARARPGWEFVMVGPVVKIDPAGLPRLPNIHWLGQKSYAELPSYLAGWEIGLMPFAANESTRFISPTKTPEFLAAGVPVISTPIADVVRPYGEKGLVEIADSAVGFVNAAEMLFQRSDPSWLARVDRHLATGSWDYTWDSMRRLVTTHAGRPSEQAGSLLRAVAG